MQQGKEKIKRVAILVEGESCNQDKFVFIGILKVELSGVSLLKIKRKCKYCCMKKVKGHSFLKLSSTVGIVSVRGDQTEEFKQIVPSEQRLLDDNQNFISRLANFLSVPVIMSGDCILKFSQFDWHCFPAHIFPLINSTTLFSWHKKWYETDVQSLANKLWQFCWHNAVGNSITCSEGYIFYVKLWQKARSMTPISIDNLTVNSVLRTARFKKDCRDGFKLILWCLFLMIKKWGSLSSFLDLQCISLKLKLGLDFLSCGNHFVVSNNPFHVQYVFVTLSFATWAYKLWYGLRFIGLFSGLSTQWITHCHWNAWPMSRQVSK